MGFSGFPVNPQPRWQTLCALIDLKTLTPPKTRLEVVVSETRSGYGGAELTWENLATGQPETSPFQGVLSPTGGFVRFRSMGVWDFVAVVKRLREVQGLKLEFILHSIPSQMF